MVFNMIGGISIESSLNYKIVGGISSPETPTDNMIWVNTDSPITSYVFSPAEPESPEEGTVWIKTGHTSIVGFNAIGMNSIMLFPLTASQYTSGAWDPKDAKTYMDNEWVDWWKGELYMNGTEYERVTGGWQGRAWSYNLDEWAAVAPTIRKDPDRITATITTGSGVLETVKDVDVTNYNYLCFKYSAFGTCDRVAMLIDRSLPTCRDVLAYKYEMIGPNGYEKKIDISKVSGFVDIIISLNNSYDADQSGITITEMWLE